MRPSSRRFVAVLATFAAVVLLVHREEEILGALLAPVTLWTAETTIRLLDVLGIEAVRQSTLFFGPQGVIYEIYYGCTGVLPVVTFAVALLALPGCSWRRRLVGLLLGVPLILAANLVRLVHLFHLGVHRPEWFPLAHSVLWEAGLVILVATAWLTWTAWAHKARGLIHEEVPI